jgi:hypothetical protein
MLRLRIVVLIAFGIVTASAKTTPQSACINNLRQIDGAKEQLQLETKLKDGDVATIAAVGAYIKAGFPTCPAGGSYTLGVIGRDPTCSVPGHSLSATAQTAKTVRRLVPTKHPLLLVLPPLLVLLIALLFRRFERRHSSQ